MSEEKRMSIAKKIIAASAAAASIATGANAAGTENPASIAPLPQEYVLSDAPFNQALKPFVISREAKLIPPAAINDELISKASERIKVKQGEGPREGQQVVFYNHALSSAIVVDAAQKTIVTFPAIEDALSGNITIKEHTPTYTYSQNKTLSQENIATQAIAAISENNALMAERIARGTRFPNLGNAFQPTTGQGR